MDEELVFERLADILDELRLKDLWNMDHDDLANIFAEAGLLFVNIEDTQVLH